MSPPVDLQLLKQDDIKAEVEKEMNSELNKSEWMHREPTDVEDTWNDVKGAIVETGKIKLKATKKEKKKQWMTMLILELMEERRKVKNSDPEKHKELQTLIRRKIREAKETWMRENCEEIEKLSEKYDMFNLHKKIKETIGRGNKNSSNMLLDKDENILLTTEEKLKAWKEYVERLFSDNRTPTHNCDELNSGPDITKEEVVNAIKLAKRGKAPGPDEIRSDLLKLIEDEKVDILVKLFQLIHRTGIIPHDWLQSTFITIPKQTYSRKCSDFRTISLMSHVLKIFLKIIHGRIYKKCEETIGETQFGFRNGFGTREALFAIQVLTQRCRDVNYDVHACFIDYGKAFDSVKHEKLLSILKNLGLDGKDLRIIARLYWNQVATIRVENKNSEEIKILRGVRQGCILSPLLFNIYSECVFKEALGEQNEGIVINGRIINNIRYADDSVLLANSKEDLEILVTKIKNVSEAYGLKINFRKTKYMVISKKPFRSTNIKVGNDLIERMQSYKYLGCHLNDQWVHSTEIRSRIEQARNAFGKMKNLLTCRDLSLKLRLRLVKCYIFPILLYGVEAWTMTQDVCRRVSAFEMWVYRRMLKISWVDRVRNEEVLQKMQTEMELMYVIKKRKLEYLGHIMRNEKYQLLQLIIQGKIQGSRSVGRRRTSWLENLRQWFNLKTVNLFRSAMSKVKIAMLLANLRRGDGT